MANPNHTFSFAIDFDGTIVEHAYPEIGKPVPGALLVLKELDKCGYKLILNTMRSLHNNTLNDAVRYLRENGLEFYGINHNPDQDKWTDSPKPYAQMYIDDAAVGCPLVNSPTGDRPYVDWYRIREILVERYILDPN